MFNPSGQPSILQTQTRSVCKLHLSIPLFIISPCWCLQVMHMYAIFTHSRCKMRHRHGIFKMSVSSITCFVLRPGVHNYVQCFICASLSCQTLKAQSHHLLVTAPLWFCFCFFFLPVSMPWRVAAHPVHDDLKSPPPWLWSPGTLLWLPMAVTASMDLTVIGVSQTTDHPRVFQSINRVTSNLFLLLNLLTTQPDIVS